MIGRCTSLFEKKKSTTNDLRDAARKLARYHIPPLFYCSLVFSQNLTVSTTGPLLFSSWPWACISRPISGLARLSGLETRTCNCTHLHSYTCTFCLRLTCARMCLRLLQALGPRLPFSPVWRLSLPQWPWEWPWGWPWGVVLSQGGMLYPSMTGAEAPRESRLPQQHKRHVLPCPVGCNGNIWPHRVAVR